MLLKHFNWLAPDFKKKCTITFLWTCGYDPKERQRFHADPCRSLQHRQWEARVTTYLLRFFIDVNKTNAANKQSCWRSTLQRKACCTLTEQIVFSTELQRWERKIPHCEKTRSTLHWKFVKTALASGVWKYTSTTLFSPLVLFLKDANYNDVDNLME